MIHSPWLDFWKRRVNWTLVQNRAKNMPLLCSRWESVWAWVGREQCYIAHRTLVSAPQVTECCSLDRPCRMENYSSVKPRVYERDGVCIQGVKATLSHCEYC